MGGLHNVIQLCLTNPNYTNTISQEQLELLREIITQTTTINDLSASRINSQPPSLSIIESSSVSTLNIDVINDNDKNNINSKTILVNNIYQFYTSSIIFDVNVNNNLYFKYLSNEKAK